MLGEKSLKQKTNNLLCVRVRVCVCYKLWL